MKIKYRDLPKKIKHKSIVSFQDMTKEEVLEKEKKSVEFLDSLKTQSRPATGRTNHSTIIRVVNNPLANMKSIKTMSISANASANLSANASANTSLIFGNNHQSRLNSLLASLQNPIEGESEPLTLSEDFETLNNNNNQRPSFFRRKEKRKTIFNTISIKNKILEEELKLRQSQNSDEIYVKSLNHTKRDSSLVNEMLDNPIKNKKDLIKTVNTWKKTVKNNKSSFNTGSFNLPLYVLKKKNI